MIKVAILGAGQIGRAVYQIITNLRDESDSKDNPYSYIDAFVIDSSKENILKIKYGSHYLLDIVATTEEDLTRELVNKGVTHVINSLPFFLNEKIALAAKAAKCAYIDFTEDDKMADRVQEIYADTNLNCAVKCGIAPGFINYVGFDLTKQIHIPESLMISVGALPRTVSFASTHPENSYNLTWSVDGLVNEYIRPCKVRKNGVEKDVDALDGLCKVFLDGSEYEAAYTSGGIGSLIRDLPNVSDIHYMTLRYPGHYKYIKGIVKKTLGDFDKLKEIFLKKFPFTNDDVIVVYANATGKDESGNLIRRTYYNKFYGIDGLTGIQSTTAGSGVSMLELMITGKISGMINHSDISLENFVNTIAFKKHYANRSTI